MVLQLPEDRWEAGMDEAARGVLIGRVYAAAAVLDPQKELPPRLNDSKKLSRKVRAELREWIEREAIAWGVGYAEAWEVDEMNILQATYLAMRRALTQVREHCAQSQKVLVDGNRFCGVEGWEHRCEPKADATWAHVAAASILAKEHHDEYIRRLVGDSPDLEEKYYLLSNMGYPSPKHLEGLRVHGASAHHRLTFRGVVQ